MAIINRRNAVLGWTVWSAAKWATKQKARTAVPGPGDYAGLNKGAIAAILAFVVGFLWFWHKQSGDTAVAE
jgi:hypothetical protein